MFVGFHPQFVFNVVECTRFVTSTVGEFDKNAAILLVWMKREDLEPVLSDGRKAGFQFP